MQLPKPNQVRNDFLKTIENLDAFVSFLSNNKYLQFEDYHSYLHNIRMELLERWNQIDLLTITDKKYSKIFEQLRKIQLKLLIDLNEIEKKHVKNNISTWEYIYREGKMRKDMIKFFKKISKQMKKIQKNI